MQAADCLQARRPGGSLSLIDTPADIRISMAGVCWCISL